MFAWKAGRGWLVLCCWLVAVPVAAGEADFIVRGAAVYTVDTDRPWASTIAIEDERIVYVGDDAGALELQGPGTRVIDGTGKMVLPGLIDSHVHPVWGGKSFTEVDLGDAGSRREFQQALRAFRAAHPKARHITGGGWVKENFAGASPRKAWIDEVVSDIPVLLEDHFGHSALANSRALALAGLDASSEDPPGGHFERDPQTGELTGLIREDAAIGVIGEQLGADSLAARTDALRQALAYLNRNGITSFMTAYMVGEPLGQSFVELHAQGELSARTTLSFKVTPDVPLEQILPAMQARRAELEAIDPPFIRADRAKLFLDGVVLSHTAAMLTPYAGEYAGHDSEGYLFPDAQLREACTALSRAGFGLHFHTVGDGAAHQALDAVAAVRERGAELAGSPTISHLTIVDPGDYGRFAALGVVANAQLFWSKHQEIIAKVEAYLGPRRSRNLYPYGSIAGAGGVLAAGSDWPVSTANPFQAMAVAATRPYTSIHTAADALFDSGAPSEDEAWLPGHRVDVPTMIRAFTMEGARLQSREAIVGSLEAGKLADLVVVDRNILEVSPAELADTQVLLTMVDGRVVFERAP